MGALTGKIIKGIGGFYYVDTEEGVIECRARGKFRHEGITPLVGDDAVIEDNYVIDILPRRNSLIRPKVANIDRAFITFAAKNPKINTEILDRFLIIAAEAGIQSLICINKADLVKEGALAAFRDIYGYYEILEVSATKGTGLDAVRERLSGVTSVFAGPSGVGKSSVINAVAPDVNLKTGEISAKISRGKHTTRETSLFPVCGGYVVDTPGFTSLSLNHIESKNLYKYFPEFLTHLDGCRFPQCSHINEPEEECGVKSAVGKSINHIRYACYIRIYNELSELEEAKYD